MRTGSAAIEPSGGTMTVKATSSPVYGLSIAVAPGSFSDKQTFTISSAPVTATTFGNGFTPVSSLIEIDNGGVQADHVMLVTIPIQASPDQFVMGFYYDEEKQTLEGIPTVYRDEKSIIVATTHFSKMVAAAAFLGAATDRTVADSGFLPGVDDWEFINYATSVNNGGQCGGQSLSEMYYYTEEKPFDDQQLFGLYDNNGMRKTSDIQGDDVLAYRLCSLVQQVIDNRWSQYMGEYKNSFYNWTDQLTFYEIKGSILLTGEPQALFIHSSDGNKSHAIVCYKVDGNTLYVADPNKPGQVRTITLADGRFQPYMSAETAADLANIAFTDIRFAGKTAMVSYSMLSSLWDQLDAGTVGDGIFPLYQVVFTFDMPDGTKKELVYDGIGKNAGVIRVGAPSDRFTVSVRGETGDTATVKHELYGDYTLEGVSQNIEVTSGGTLMGVEGKGLYGGGWARMGFGWFDVVPGEVSPTPAPTKKPTATPKPTPVRQAISQDWLNSAYEPVSPIPTAYSYYSNGQPARMMYVRADSRDNLQELYVVKYMNDGSVQAAFHYNANGMVDWYKWYDAYGTVVKHVTYDSAGGHYIVGSDSDMFYGDPYMDEPYQNKYWQEWRTAPTPTDTGVHPVYPPDY